MKSTKVGWSAVFLTTWAIGIASEGSGRSKLATRKIIDNVAVSPAFFNPSLGQKETIRVSLLRPGRVSVTVLDRDRFVIRALPAKNSNAGSCEITWDGKDDQGRIVPDESYPLRIEFKGTRVKEMYDPSLHHIPIVDNPVKRSYSRTDGILAYSLSRASRVHIEAGEAVKNEKTGHLDGPVLKTVVDRLPRVAGAISEKWNGFDEGGSIYVPDLPNFVYTILATSLPDNSIITVGNRGESFFEYAVTHRPADAVSPRMLTAASHEHHSGLTVFEDHSPSLEARPDGKWDPSRRIWEVHSPLKVLVELKKPLDSYFLAQPNELEVYCDGKKVVGIKQPSNPQTISLDSESLPPGEHRVQFNWTSDFGPVAANSFRVASVPVGQSLR